MDTGKSTDYIRFSHFISKKENPRPTFEFERDTQIRESFQCTVVKSNFANEHTMTILRIEDDDVMTAESYWHRQRVEFQSEDDDSESSKSQEIDVDDQKPIIVPRAANSESFSRSPITSWTFWLGIFYAFMSGLIFTANNWVIQTFTLDYADAVLTRGFVQVIFIGLLCCLKGYSFWPQEKPAKLGILMILQGIFGGIMVICTYSCVLFLPLGDAMTLVFSAPICTMVMAAIFLGHRLRLFKITFGFLLLTGTILVVRPPFIFYDDENQNENNVTENFITLLADVNTENEDKMVIVSHNEIYYIGVAIALASTLVDGLLNVTINVLSEIPSLILLWWAGVSSIVISAVAYSFDEDARIFTLRVIEIAYFEWLAYLGVAFAGILAYFCMTKALQMIDPTVVAYVRALEIVFAYVVQVVFMHQMPAILSIVGATLVLFSVIAIAAQEKFVSVLPERVRFIF